MMSPKNELQSLCDWLNIDRPEFPWCAVSAFSPYWRERKLIRPVGRQRTTAHCNCDFDHEEEVFYPHGDPVILCSYTGCWRSVDKEELRFWSFDGNAMANILGELFSCKGAPREIIGGRLWGLGMTAHRLGGIPCDVYFALRMVGDASVIYEKLPQESRQAILIVGSARCEQSEHFPSDRIFHMSEILDLTSAGFVLKHDELDIRLCGIPKEEKEKPDAGARPKNVAAIQKELEAELYQGWSFYCNRNSRSNEEGQYPRLTLEQLAARIGSTKGTVSKIINAKKNGKAKYPLLLILWESLACEDGIMSYGRSHFGKRH